MAHEETIYTLMQELVIADKHTIGDLMAHKKIWTAGVSAENNSYKALSNLVDYEKLEKGKEKYYRIKGCRSDYKEHARAVTAVLASIIKLNLDYKILREPTLKNIGLRPDSLIMLTKNNHSLVMVLEVCLEESKIFLEQKVHAWQQYDAALEELSTLFQTTIEAYDIVVSGDYIPEGTFEFNQYLENIKEVI